MRIVKIKRWFENKFSTSIVKNVVTLKGQLLRLLLAEAVLCAMGIGFYLNFDGFIRDSILSLLAVFGILFVVLLIHDFLLIWRLHSNMVFVDTRSTKSINQQITLQVRRKFIRGRYRLTIGDEYILRYYGFNVATCSALYIAIKIEPDESGLHSTAALTYNTRTRRLLYPNKCIFHLDLGKTAHQVSTLRWYRRFYYNFVIPYQLELASKPSKLR